jgi:light-regulated signal transduction histidine kinase (bacteriophytochrome)
MAPKGCGKSLLIYLNFSKVGQADDKREEVDLREVVLEITGLFKKQIEDQGAEIAFNNLPIVQTFRAPIRQVFQNLIANGLKYQKSGEKPRIDITYREVEKKWEFSIKDNGIGINDQYFDKIFIIFRRLHNKEEYAGTGMGLAFTKKNN